MQFGTAKARQTEACCQMHKARIILEIHEDVLAFKKREFM